MRRTRLFALTLIGGIVALAAATSLPGSATAAGVPDPHKSGVVRAKPAADQHHPDKVGGVARLAPYKGYRIVNSSTLAVAAGQQTFGDATCPFGATAVGGGAVIFGNSLRMNVNSSFPNGTTSWRAFVNNAEPSTAGTFSVYAVCVKKVAKYSVVSGTSTVNVAGEQTSATATCPAKTFPLGGGGVGSSTSTLQNLNSSYPISKGWQVDMNNASPSGSFVNAVVVCGKKPTGYVVTSAASAPVPHNTQASASAACPANTVVLSGGVRSNSGATSVNINTTYPNGSSAWISFENNASTGDSSITPYAICAQGS